MRFLLFDQKGGMKIIFSFQDKQRNEEQQRISAESVSARADTHSASMHHLQLPCVYVVICHYLSTIITADQVS